MKICVLSGSPKGNYSITLQTVFYLQQRFPDCEFEILHIGQQIKAIERDFSRVLPALESADMLLFCYPVYTFIVPSQLHRFIELVKSNGVDLSGKLACQISTSLHFYDVTAHRFIEDNCGDLGLNYIGGLSADMEDLLSEKGQADAVSFWKYVLFCAENGIFKPNSALIPKEFPAYTASIPENKKHPGEIVVVTNCKNDPSLSAMLCDFSAQSARNVRVVNIAEYPFTGGCLGCFNCAVTGKCVYKDGFDEFLRNEIQTADAIVYAFTIRDHSMGADFKMFDDRQFCNGHRTVTMGMPVGYIVRGDLDSEPNLKMIIEARAEVGGNFLAGIATSREQIVSMASTLEYALENKLTLPATFYGVGGMKIFRDLIWVMRGMMKADHKFYKEHGFYDFPQKQRGKVLKMKLVGLLISSPSVKSKMGNKMNEGMIAPYKKVLERPVSL